jgi:hypothetical protein
MQLGTIYWNENAVVERLVPRQRGIEGTRISAVARGIGSRDLERFALGIRRALPHTAMREPRSRRALRLHPRSIWTAEMHDNTNHVFIIVDGEAEFITRGKMVDR